MARDTFAKQHEFELRKYQEAETTLATWTDAGRKVDIKVLNEAMAYLRKEEFMLNWELDSRKTNIRRLEIVKREFVKDRKEKGRYDEAR